MQAGDGDESRLILLISSDYCYGIEMKRALERHKAGEPLVVPIILRPVSWQQMPFGSLQALPKDGKPVAIWADRDSAYVNIAEGLKVAIEDLVQDQAAFC